MTENPNIIDVMPIDDFVTVVVDGAYLHFQEGFVSFLFFQDKTFPSHNMKDGSMAKRRTKREILHEVRMAIEPAETLKSNLADGLGAYNEFGALFESRDLWQNPTLEKPEEAMSTADRPDEMEAILWRSYMQMYKNCTKTGQKKILDVLGTALHEHIDEIRQIAKKYAKDKKKVFAADESK